MREWQWAKANVFKKLGWVVQVVLIDCNEGVGTSEIHSWVILVEERESVWSRGGNE